MPVTDNAMRSVVSVGIAFLLTGCGATQVRPSPHNITASSLMNPFTRPAAAKMLHGSHPDSPKAVYVTGNSTLTVSCRPNAGRPSIDMDGDSRGATLYCGRWPLWHVEFSQKLKGPLQRKWTSDNNRRRIHLKIPGIWD